MTTTTTIAAIVGLVITILVLIYLHQWRQRTNDAKRRQLNVLNSKLRQYEAIIKGIPSQYADKSVLSLVAQAGCESVDRLIDIESKNKYGKLKEDWILLADRIKSGESLAPAINPADEAAGKELRQHLQTLYKFIEKQIKLRKIEKSFGTRQLMNIQFILSKSLADAHVARAKLAEKQQKHRVAIHHIHNAIEAFSKLSQNPMAQKAIIEYREMINKLDKEADKISESKVQGVKQDTENTLSSQLDELSDDEDVWKRKQDYDD